MQNSLWKKGIVIGIILLFFGASVISNISGETTDTKEPALLGYKGWLEEIEGVKILHLNGSYYDMGYQHGYLLKNEINANMRILFNFFEEMGFSYSTLIDSMNILIDYIPERYMLEIQGIADGSESSFERICIYNILHDIANFISCSGAIVWGSATANGELIHLRSTDHVIFLGDPDPVTGKYLQENQVLIVRKPIDDYASMSPMWAGRIGSWGGINEKGIGISETTCWTTDVTLHGTCAAFRMGLVLDTADSANEAISIMNLNKTVGWNFLISDGNKSEGYVLEQTANISYVSTWDDPVESKNPFWSIKDALRRSNCFLNPDCAKSQRKFYNPRNLRSIFLYLIGKHSYFCIWKHYVALSKGIENNWGSLDLVNSMTMLQDVYKGKTDFIFFFMQKINAFLSMHQWTAYPKTGDMLICFASKDKIASYNNVHKFNLFELLESEPS